MASVDHKFDLLFDHGLDLKDRKVYLHGTMEGKDEEGLEPGPTEKTIKALLFLDKNPGGIQLWVNTPGGSVVEMFGLYDIIRSLESEVTTIGFGQVCSAGGLILVAGDKRFATRNCMFMSHLGENDLSGDLYTMEDQINFDKKLHERWVELMAKHTSKDKRWWRELHKRKRELWLSSEDMLKHGIIDDIWGKE